MSFKVFNYLDVEVEPVEKTDVVDLCPSINGGRGLGFDMTFMDRDGDIAAMTTDNSTWAWIGWSSESKVNQPQFYGTLLFSTEFKEITRVASWELF